MFFYQTYFNLTKKNSRKYIMDTPFTTTFIVQKFSFFVTQKFDLNFIIRYWAKKQIKNSFRDLNL